MRTLALSFVVAAALAACDRPTAPPPAPPSGPRLADLLRSTARAPGVDLPRAELEAQAASATRGYTDERRAFAVALDDLATLSLRVEAGRCYRAVVRLERDATYSDLAERGLRFDVTLPGAAAPVPSGGIVGPGAIFDLRCATESGNALVSVVPLVQSATAAMPVGSGRARISVYSRPIQLAARAARRGPR